jgi:hypothetical protein
MIELGQSSEFASQLLLLFAKDLYVHKLWSSPDESCYRADSLMEDFGVLDCRPVSVLGLLEFMFGPMFWPEGEARKEAVWEAFKDACVNFSHWTPMVHHIIGGDKSQLTQLVYVPLQSHWIKA